MSCNDIVTTLRAVHRRKQGVVLEAVGTVGYADMPLPDAPTRRAQLPAKGERRGEAAVGDALTRLPVRDARWASTRAGMRKRGASRRLPRSTRFFRHTSSTLAVVHHDEAFNSH